MLGAPGTLLPTELKGTAADISSNSSSRWTETMWQVVLSCVGIVSLRLEKEKLHPDATKAQKKGHEALLNVLLHWHCGGFGATCRRWARANCLRCVCVCVCARHFLLRTGLFTLDKDQSNILPISLFQGKESHHDLRVDQIPNECRTATLCCFSGNSYNTTLLQMF